ncbi:hypothetical protein Ahu01nite_023930 [Winogradskya humida]|uniref:Uncharacterized protein n=1 Tax=Winogradskya humida TaxID=113566 RepID=A0ABQ3ZL18_9ACTN|nr:hypothetical protein Ahu01nite_023930 [Actinoplanes humidus]
MRCTGGHGLILRPSGIEAAKSAGTMTIPWEALAAEQPGRGPVWHEIKLAYAHPHRPPDRSGSHLRGRRSSDQHLR